MSGGRLSDRLRVAANGLDVAGDSSSSAWLEDFADDARSLEAENERLLEALHRIAERETTDPAQTALVALGWEKVNPKDLIDEAMESLDSRQDNEEADDAS